MCPQTSTSLGNLSWLHLPFPICYGLNMPPKFMCWKLDPQCDSIGWWMFKSGEARMALSSWLDHCWCHRKDWLLQQRVPDKKMSPYSFLPRPSPDIAPWSWTSQLSELWAKETSIVYKLPSISYSVVAQDKDIILEGLVHSLLTVPFLEPLLLL
jgi:hypothetical protein